MTNIPFFTAERVKMKKIFVILFMSLGLFSGNLQSAGATTIYDALAAGALPFFNVLDITILAAQGASDFPNSAGNSSGDIDELLLADNESAPEKVIEKLISEETFRLPPDSFSQVDDRVTAMEVLVIDLLDKSSAFGEPIGPFWQNSIPGSTSADTLFTQFNETAFGDSDLITGVGNTAGSTSFRVPEPVTMLLFGAGLASFASLFGSRRRTKN